MDWLIAALGRHVAQRVLLRDRSPSAPEFSEYELVRCLDAIFTGLGYDLFPEWKSVGRRIDLRAQCPTCSERDPEFMIEAKFIWDGEDGRLNATRFRESREILKDFAPLPGGGPSTRHIVVWLVASRSAEVVTKGAEAKTLRLGDIVTHVGSGLGRLAAEPMVLDIGALRSTPVDYPFMHLYLWEPAATE